MGAGVKLMYGFRFETQDQRDLHDKSFMKFDKFSDYVQPRLGFTWDVNQDGKTKVSGNYAKYFEQIPQRMAIRVYANETYLRWNYRHHQLHLRHRHRCLHLRGHAEHRHGLRHAFQLRSHRRRAPSSPSAMSTSWASTTPSPAAGPRASTPSTAS